MYCEGSIENEFMASFNKVNTYKISKKYLYLYHDTELLMMFVKAK